MNWKTEKEKDCAHDHCQIIYSENWRGDSRLNSIFSVVVTPWQNYNQFLVYCCLLIHRIVSNYFVETKSIRQTPDPDRTSRENLAFPLYFLSSISFADHTNRNRSLRFTNDRFRIIGSTITRIVDEFHASIRTIRFISSFFQNVSIIMLFVVRYALFSTRRFIFSFFLQNLNFLRSRNSRKRRILKWFLFLCIMIKTIMSIQYFMFNLQNCCYSISLIISLWHRFSFISYV